MLTETPLVIEPPQPAEYTVIWLHGLGASGDDFADMPRWLNFSVKNKTRFVFPHAPVQPVTINNGMPMPAWFDIASLDSAGQQDQEGLEAAGQAVEALIENERENGIPDERIVLGGFSQGGAVALYHGIRRAATLAGVVGFSCYLPDAINTPGAENRMPILMMHGTQDPVVDYHLGEESANTLLDNGYNLVFDSYEIAHNVCQRQFTDFAAWLDMQLGQPT